MDLLLVFIQNSEKIVCIKLLINYMIVISLQKTSLPQIDLVKFLIFHKDGFQKIRNMCSLADVNEYTLIFG